MNRYFRLNDSDNVAVVLFDAQPGDKLDFEGLHVTVTEPVPYGHKVALCEFPYGGYRIQIRLLDWQVYPGHAAGWMDARP